MTASHRPLAPLALALAAACAIGGCDQEPGSTMDYEAVVHVEIGTLTKVPFVAKALKESTVDGDVDLSVCRDALLSADALTVGTGNRTFELYLSGTLDKTAVDTCHAALEDAHRKSHGKADAKSTKKVEVHWLSPTLFAIVGAEGTPPVPSKARLQSLLANDPTPTTANPSALWVVARDDEGKKDVSHVEAWADVTKGLDLHADVEFDSITDATKIYGQAMLGLSALKAAGELGDMSDAVSLSHGGDTLTVEVHATRKQLEGLATKISSEHSKGPHRKHGGDSHGVSIRIGTSEDAD